MLQSDLSIIVRGSEIYLSRCLSDFGIRATEQAILMYLYGHENPNQEEIAKFFMLDRGTVTKTLQKLEKKSFIKRTINPSNQREKVITLTDKAYAVKDVCVNLLRKWNDMAYQSITPEEKAAFEHVAEKVAVNVAADLEKWGKINGKQNG